MTISLVALALMIGPTMAHATPKGVCHRPTVKATIWCAVHHYDGVPGGVRYAVYIAERESGFYPLATSPTGCMGIYQFARSTWAHLIRSWPEMNRPYGTSAYNARGNVMRAIRTAHEVGWDAWGG